jgi:hypothetical protein
MSMPSWKSGHTARPPFPPPTEVPSQVRFPPVPPAVSIPEVHSLKHRADTCFAAEPDVPFTPASPFPPPDPFAPGPPEPAYTTLSRIANADVEFRTQNA